MHTVLRLRIMAILHQAEALKAKTSELRDELARVGS